MESEKILLADDDPKMVGLLSGFLREQGYEVTSVANGNQALDIIKREEFHLALLDLMLPGLSGLELLSALKSLSPETEVILFTGQAGLDSAIQAIRLGAYDYLLKANLRLNELQTVITRALERRQLAQSNRRLLDHLRQTQEELTKRRAMELTQVRRIGETLAGPLSIDQLFQGLGNLIWEGLPLKVLGMEFQGAESELSPPIYVRGPQVAEAVFQGFQNWLQERLRDYTQKPPVSGANSRQKPCEAILAENLQAGEVVAMVAAGRDFPFSPEEAELFRIFMLQGQAALKNLMLFEEVKSLAVRDGLTGLYNYRYFSEIMRYEVEKCRRYNIPLALIFLDIDDFKAINDANGHPQGDQILKRVAALLRGGIRQADLLCRYGGDEFALLLTQTSAEQALVLAERLRRLISQTPLSSPRQNYQVTISIGVAELEPGMDWEGLLKAADAAHYRAKEGGKNRVSGPADLEREQLNPGAVAIRSELTPRLRE
jgi:two-component system, cell cycle response regulator